MRPLLGVRAAALRAFCAEHRLPAVQDPSNEDHTQARNQIRTLLAGRRLGPGLQGLDPARSPAAAAAQRPVPGQGAERWESAHSWASDSEPAPPSSPASVTARAAQLLRLALTAVRGARQRPLKAPEPAPASATQCSQPSAPAQHVWDPAHGMRVAAPDGAGPAGPGACFYADPAVQRAEEPVDGASALPLDSASAAWFASPEPEHGARMHDVSDTVLGGARPQQAGERPPAPWPAGPVHCAGVSGVAGRTHAEADGVHAGDCSSYLGPELSSHRPGPSAVSAGNASCAPRSEVTDTAERAASAAREADLNRLASAAREADVIRLARACAVARQRLWAQASALITAAVQPRLGALWSLPRPGSPAGLATRPPAEHLSGSLIGGGAEAGGRGWGRAGSRVGGIVGGSGVGARDHVAEGQREVALRCGTARLHLPWMDSFTVYPASRRTWIHEEGRCATRHCTLQSRFHLD